MKHKSIDEINKLVMECRTSGLTDHQWCKANPQYRSATAYAGE